MKIYIITLMMSFAIIVTYSCNKDKVNYDDIFTVDIDKRSLTADGNALAEITLKVNEPGNVANDKRNVTFKIAPIGTFHDGKDTYSTNVDISGEAKASVKSADTGVAYISVTIGDTYTRVIQVAFTAPDEIVDSTNYTLVADTVIADNYTYATIVAETNIAILKDGRTDVTFSTEDGTFSNGTKQQIVSTDPVSGRAIAYLKRNTPGKVKVTMALPSGYKREVFVNFTKSYPQQITINAPAILNAQFGEKATITAQLLRTNGIVSSAQIVSYYDSIPGGFTDTIGRFFNITKSNADGQSTAEYSIQDTSYKGYVYIIGYTDTSVTGRVKGINRIYIQ